MGHATVSDCHSLGWESIVAIDDTGAGATRSLAESAAKLRFETLPIEVVHQAKRLILDTLGNGIAGSRSEFGRASLEWVAGMRMQPEATMFGGGGQTSAPFAACANARMIDAYSASETFVSVHQTYHHGATTISAALAQCEKMGSSGRDLIVAVTAAYEFGARLAIGLIPGPDTSAHGGGLRPGGFGPGNIIGAAVAAARAMGLTADQTAHAIGLAGLHIDGPALKWFEVYRPPMVKSADGGWQAMTGMMAASMASHGITGYDTILDGATGLWRALGYADCDFQAMLDRQGEKWYILDAAFKAWPCQHWMHQALTALQELLEEHRPAPADIERIVLRTNSRSNAPRFHDPNPPGEIERSYSFPHAAAMLALDIPSGPRWVSDELAADPVVARLRGLVEVELDPTTTEFRDWVVDYQVREMPASATIYLSGRAFERTVRHGRGDPWSPETRLSDEALATKFRNMASEVGDGSASWNLHIERLIEHVMNLERVDDVTTTALLSGRAH